MNNKNNKLLGILLAWLISTTAIGITPYMSQNHTFQDKYLNEHIFHNKKNGVFIDIGAHDGKSLSNTYFFEKELNWTGVCFEPLPEAFEKLKANRSCICINACVSDRDGQVQFIQVDDLNPHQIPAYSHNMLSGMLHTYEQKHMDRLLLTMATTNGGSYKIVNMPSRTLNSVCKEHNIKHVDFISLDTEGGELLILQSINFDEVNISVICVENNYASGAIRTFLESKNFNYVALLGGQDEIYVNKNYPQTAPAA